MTRRGDEDDGPDLDDDERDVNNKIDDFIDDLLVHHDITCMVLKSLLSVSTFSLAA